jgi:hypothetical protein
VGPNDGFLYLSVGDGGGASDPNGHGQDKGDWLGNILRLEFERQRGARESVLLARQARDLELRLRNPWRFSFDRQNGDLYIADVGRASARRSTCRRPRRAPAAA